MSLAQTRCHGGGLGWGCRVFFQLTINRLKHAIYVAQDVGVPESDDPISVLTHLRGSPFIIGDVVSVLAAVHLYYQAALMTAEVGDKAFDGVGALEAIAQIATAQMVPCTPILTFPPGTEWGKGKSSAATGGYVNSQFDGFRRCRAPSSITQPSGDNAAFRSGPDWRVFSVMHHSPGC